jgi:hypothetical protein
MLIEENLYEVEARLEHKTEITETPCTRDQHLQIISSHSCEAAYTSVVHGDCSLCFATTCPG